MSAWALALRETWARQSCAWLTATALGLASSLALAGLEVLPVHPAPQVFVGAARPIDVHVRNAGREPATVELRARLFQASSATAMRLGDLLWKRMTVLPGQTVLDTVTFDFPAVRAETTFIVQWLDPTDSVLGMTEIRVFPTNLLERLRLLIGDTPLGLMDPDNQLKPPLRRAILPYRDLADTGVDAFTGRLAFVGPCETGYVGRVKLKDGVRALAKRGVGVVWFQSEPPTPSSLRPSFYIVRVGEAGVVVAQASLVFPLADDPEAQLRLIRLAELALQPVPFDLPEPPATP